MSEEDVNLIKWDPILSVAHEEMDRQHRRMLDLINALHKAAIRKYGNTALADMLKELVAVTKVHFAAEERLMEAHGYPGLPAHKDEHETLLGQLAHMAAEHREGKLVLTRRAVSYLGIWLNGHILGPDQAFATYRAADTHSVRHSSTTA